MIKSMTGFGRCEIQQDSKKFTVELKSVNHRYLDVNIRMPKKLNFFETSIRTLLKSYANRGNVDIFITYEDFTENQVALKYNEPLAKEYLDAFKKMEETFGLENDIRVSTVSRCPEVLTMEEQSADEDELWKGLKKALEGALKLKEISYVHAEAYAAGELKHGTIALITENVPVIALATQESVYGKMISNIREVKARGAYVILVSMDEEYNDKDVCDKHISIPKQDGLFTVFSAAVILQLIAYYTSDAKGLDVDKPRNLAKSVTVE